MADMTKEQFEEGQKIFSEIIAKYYGDPEFKAKVDQDPTGTLAGAGMKIPQGTSVKLLFNTDKLVHVVLPHVDGD